MTPHVTDYAYSPPSEAEARLAVERHVGRDALEAIWAQACDAVSARRSGAPLTHDELLPIAAYLARRDGALRIVGRSLELRIRTYALLAARAAAAATPRAA